MVAANSIAEQLRLDDYDRYLSTLYAPVEKRDALTALYAFNAEIAAIRDRVREPLAGEVRLQWWRDALAGGAETAAGHPIAEALSKTIADHNLPLTAFDNYLETRIFDLYDDPMPDRNSLEGYCGETACAIVQLAGLVLAPNSVATSAEAAGHGGCAQAIAGLLRLLPIHRNRGQCYVPADILAAVGTTSEELIAGKNRASALAAIQAMVALARDHLAAFEAKAVDIDPRLRPAFLPVALTGPYLDALEREGDKALDESADISIIRRHWSMLRAAMRGWR